MKRANRTLGLRLRVVLAPGVALGPGKADLLAAVAETGSLTAASKRMGMSYRRAWLLIEELNAIFSEPLVKARKGGRGGGGSAELTHWGREVLDRYRKMVKRADAAIEKDMRALKKRLKACPGEP
jgi:molybdate transport system regulatory protein